MQTPHALVLGGGGTLGEAWMSSVLAGLDEADGFDARGSGCLVGTSAGSIVAASLVAGIAPGSRLGRLAPAEDAQLEDSFAQASALRQAFGVAAELVGVAAACAGTGACGSRQWSSQRATASCSALAGAFGAVSRGAAATEALVLKGRGATVTTVNPDNASAAAMGLNLMDHARRGSVIEAGLAQGRRLALDASARAA